MIRMKFLHAICNSASQNIFLKDQQNKQEITHRNVSSRKKTSTFSNYETRIGCEVIARKGIIILWQSRNNLSLYYFIKFYYISLLSQQKLMGF